MLRKTMIALATASALTGGLAADAFAGWLGAGSPWEDDPTTVAPDEQLTYPARMHHF